MTTSTSKVSVPTVRFGRRSTRGVMLGLSAPRVAALAVALIVALPAVYLNGFTGLVWTSPAWGTAVAAAWVTIGSRHAVEWLPIYGHWVARRTLGQHLYRVRVLRPRPLGALALPGDAARLRHHHDLVTGAAMIHDPVANTITAAAKVRHPSFYLLAEGDQARRVAGWGRALATCCASGRIARVQVLERALPDSGEGIRQYWAEHGRRDGGWAATQYEQLVEHAGTTSERHETTISISVDLTRTRRAVRAHGGGITGAAAVLRQEMTTLAAALHSAELVVDGWVEPDDLAGILRLAYDPAAVHRLDRAPRVGRDLETAGPTLVTEDLDHLRTDSAFHSVYWISEWPRSEVHPSFLQHLLIAPGVRRTFCLVAQPLTTAEAMRSLRRERVEYQADAAQRHRIGQITDYATEQEWADVNQRERDLVAGHGDLRFAGFLCVTAPTLAALQEARSTIEQAAVNVGCESQGVLTNPNALLAGVIGTGKSALAKSLATRSVAFGIRVYVPGDPKGEWTPVTRAVGGTAIILGQGQPTRLNPLDEGRRPAGLTDHQWSTMVWARQRDLLGVLAETVLGRPLRPVEHTALDTALTATTRSAAVPTLPDVVAHLLAPDGATTDDATLLRVEGRDVAHALRRMVHGDLAGLFDGPSTVRFDPDAPMISLDLSGVSGNDTLLSLVMTCASTWMEAAILDPEGGRRWVIYDEAWRVMRHPALIRRMQTQWKLSRAYGIANLMVIHRLSDLDAVGEHHSEARALAQGLLADCSTRIIYRQETDQLAQSASALGLTEAERDRIATLGVGQGLWRIRDRGFVVQHQMTVDELATFDTIARML